MLIFLMGVPSPNPLKGDFSGSGNSSIQTQPFSAQGANGLRNNGTTNGITGSLQWHQLEDRTVLKVSARNGTVGQNRRTRI